MAITKIRKGCSTFGIVGIAIAAVGLVLGMIYTGGFDRRVDPAELQRGDALFTTEGVTTYQGEYSARVDALLKQTINQQISQGAGAEITPLQALSFREQALSFFLQRAIAFKIAQDNGINVDDTEAMIAWFKKDAEKKVAQKVEEAKRTMESRMAVFEQQLEKQKKEHGENSEQVKAAKSNIEKLKNTTFDQFYKELYGISQQDEITQTMAFINANMKDPAAALDLQAYYVDQRIREAYEAKVDTSDEAIKKSFDEFKYQILLILKRDNDDPEAKANEILKKIKAGMDFNDAVMQYTNSKDAEGRPDPGINTQTRLEIEAAGTYTQILDLKPGEISDVIPLEAGAAIYKVLSFEQKAPAKIELIREQRSRMMREQLGQKMLSETLKAKREQAIETTKWNDQGLKLLEEYVQLRYGEKSKQLTGAAKRKQRMEAFQNIFDRCSNLETFDRDLPVLLRYACFLQIDGETPAEEKDKLNEERLLVYQDVLDILGSNTLRFEYVNLLINDKRGDDALLQLLEIVKSSFEINEANRKNIEKVELILPQAANVAKENSQYLTEVQEEIALWRKNEAERKAEELEIKKQEEEEKKRREQEEENLRKIEEQEKTQQKKQEASPSSQPR